MTSMFRPANALCPPPYCPRSGIGIPPAVGAPAGGVVPNVRIFIRSFAAPASAKNASARGPTNVFSVPAPKMLGLIADGVISVS